MTSETEAQTKPWVEKHGVKYAYAYDKGKSLMRDLSLNSYPSAALVNPAGNVVWTGNPGGINDALIEQHIAGASTLPPGIGALQKLWGDEGSKVIAALQKGQLAKALQEAEKAEGENAQAMLDAVKKRVAGKAQGLKSMLESGDILGFLEGAALAKKDLKGLPEGKEIDDLVKETKGNKDAKATLKAQEFVARIAAKARDAKRKKDLDPLIGALEKFLAQVEGESNFGIEAGRKLLTDLQKLQEQMRF